MKKANPGKEALEEDNTMNSRIVCPRCGGKVDTKLVFTSQFCGVRAVASCRQGCTLTPQEQQKIDLEASDEVFTN